MAEQTGIEWADSTFNPWIGCTEWGPGCKNCYAKALMDTRLHRVKWGKGEPRVRTKTWRDPVAWNGKSFFECIDCGWRGDDPAETELAGGVAYRRCTICGSGDLQAARRRVFCASLADVFDNEVDPAWRAELFALIGCTPNLDWLLVTKRIGNVEKMLQQPGMPKDGLPGNVWLGATVVNQAEADRDVPKLLKVQAAVRFLSIEPMLGPIDLRFHIFSVPTGRIREQRGKRQMQLRKPDDGGLHWVICGGESGDEARPIQAAWVRSLRDQCKAAGVPFLFKQWGEYLPAESDEADPGLPDIPDSMLYWSDGSKWDRFDGQRGGVELVAKVGKKVAGRELDGATHTAWPR